MLSLFLFFYFIFLFLFYFFWFVLILVNMPNSASISTYTTMMRVNSKGRPYAKDLFDLYSALLIQQPLTDHRSMFRTYPSTFTTDEAVEILGHLEFTQLVSTPNPIDPSSPILTRTTTTFNMSRTMAKNLGQHFINARLVENATDPQNRTMKDRGIWAPTPKGKFMIQDFSHRARVPIKHMQTSLARVHSFSVVMFERLLDDDQISFSRPNMMEAFKTMLEWLPTDSIMIDDIGGVNTDNVKEYKDTFYGYQCFEWISEYTSVVSKEEAEIVAAEFVQYGWVLQLLDKSDRELSKKDDTTLFKAGRKIQYYLTDRGQNTQGGAPIDDGSVIQIENTCDFGFSSTVSTTSSTEGTTVCSVNNASNLSVAIEAEDDTSLNQTLEQLKISNHRRSESDSQHLLPIPEQPQPLSSQNARLQYILEDPLIRMYFRQFLKSSFCEENINFWVDYIALVGQTIPSKLRDSLLVHCCVIYNTYFCPENAPSELNIDHGLRYDIVQYMQATFTSTTQLTDDSGGSSSGDDHQESSPLSNHKTQQKYLLKKKAVVADAANVPFGSISDSPQTCLFKILHLYDQVNEHVCRTMAQDSVPRFIKTEKYKELMQSYYQSTHSTQKDEN
ncbi:MAG: hypothetical protein EXX96DRAFT_515213 [Benjaminiella poitrasii]|nr:MAG: hypothetical protein EXX96DRAFT_515213 [Benjaminiella poitrasii]